MIWLNIKVEGSIYPVISPVAGGGVLARSQTRRVHAAHGQPVG